MSIETPEIKQITINVIEMSGGTQSRTGFDEVTVVEYLEAMSSGAVFPPVDVYYDGEKYWLADGFHRLLAALRAKLPTIAAVVHQGTRRDAVLHSVGANAAHGLRRTNADKRCAVETLLWDGEWGKWSDREIARRCGVGNKFVGDARKSICVPNTDSGRTVSRNGATYLQNTGNIGRIKTYADGTARVDIKAIDVPDSEVNGLDAGVFPDSAIATSGESLLPLPPSPGTENQAETELAAFPVPPIKQISLSLVLELWELSYPGELEEDDGTPILLHCPITRSWWSEEWDTAWEQNYRPEVEAFNSLAEQVNLCLWQIDNTFAVAHPRDVYSVGGRLAEYGLLVMDEDSTPPATAKQLASWIVSQERQYGSLQEIVRDALQYQQFDMLQALEVGRHPPVDRHAYWTHRYSSELCKTGVNYWDWRGNPESREICKELTQLLELPRPNSDASTVLELLADGDDPFQRFPLIRRDVEQKDAYRKAFTTWHEKAIAQIGLDALKRLYTVVYGCDWELIENIINSLLGGEWWEVLGVPRYASAEEVKVADRGLAKEWHPDTNKSPLAPERIIAINRALEEFKNNL